MVLLANIGETRKVETHAVLTVGGGGDHTVKYLLLPGDMLGVALEGMLLVLRDGLGHVRPDTGTWSYSHI